MTTKITLTANSYFGGSATIEFSEDGCRLISDTRKANDGYLHLSAEQMEMPAPSEALRVVLARYYMRPEADVCAMLGLPARSIDKIDRSAGFIRPPAGGASLCRWAFRGLGPDATAKLAGLDKTPALNSLT